MIVTATGPHPRWDRAWTAAEAAAYETMVHRDVS